MIDLKITLQILGTLVALVGIPKVYLDSSIASRSRLRDDYKFAKEYLSDVHGEESMHRYLREKGSQAITGKRDADPEHVEFLLSLVKPSKALHLYAAGKQCLETSYANGNRYLENPNRSGVVSLVFKNRFQKRWKRNFVRWFFFLLYCVPASSLMWAPGLIRHVVDDVDRQLALVVAWFPIAILLGWFLISKAKRITWAALLMKLIAEDRELKEHIRFREATK
ncbi:hypothetical protein V4C53_43515 [Paraburkholderia azotifigens]|uniref:hypothetical protein n=1 Tax=Paraburkholderia azotifigens TaxID=2057004 RepID=UPI0031729ABE